MKNKKLMIIIGSSLAFIIFFILIFHKSFAVPLESGTKVASNTDLTYYIDVIYDGVMLVLLLLVIQLQLM